MVWGLCFLPYTKEAHVGWIDVSKLSLSGCVCVWPWHGRAPCPRLGPTWCPELPGQALATCDPELGWAGWEIIVLRIFYDPFLNVCVAHIYFSAQYWKLFLSLFRNLGIFMWPEIGCRNLTLVYYINEPKVKLVSLYDVSFKVPVSKAVGTTVSEDLLDRCTHVSELLQ